MLYEIMLSIRNFFPRAWMMGEFEIKNWHISLPEGFIGEYYLIEGSMLNDGVHKVGDLLENETFTGTVTALAPPKAFLDLCNKIMAWQEKYGEEAATSPYESESFGGYSYTKAKGSNGANVGWEDVFRRELNTWRKV